MHVKLLVAAHRSNWIYVIKKSFVKNSSSIEACTSVSVSSQQQCLIRDIRFFLDGRRMAQKYMWCKILAMYFTRKRRTTGSALKSCCLSVINEAKTTVGDDVICWRIVLRREKGQMLRGIPNGWQRDTSSFDCGSCGRYFHWRNRKKTFEKYWESLLKKLHRQTAQTLLKTNRRWLTIHSGWMLAENQWRKFSKREICS
jgi:hypothetical protein